VLRAGLLREDAIAIDADRAVDADAADPVARTLGDPAAPVAGARTIAAAFATMGHKARIIK